LEPRLLRAHQPQDDDAVVGHVTQRLEAPRSRIVVLEQKAREARLTEDLAGDAVVSARGVEHALIVAAADVDAEGDAGMAVDDGVVELDAGVEQAIGIAATLPVALAHLLVEERRVLRRIALDVGAAAPAHLRPL